MEMTEKQVQKYVSEMHKYTNETWKQSQKI